MRKTEKAEAIRKILEKLYPDPAIPLTHDSPYTLLIAVVLSAQCTDARVNTVTPTLFALANTPEKMAKVAVELIQEIIRPCGLSQRKAQAISGLSRILCDRYNGEVPRTFEELESLPGVGHKTASVVMTQAFGKPAFPVDTNIHRCAKRWGLSTGKNVEQTEKDLKRLYDKKYWNKLHLQIIYFAREFCRARGHHPETCPICSFVVPRYM